MNSRVLLISWGLTLLSSCFPAKDLSPEAVQTVISARAGIHQIATTAVNGLQAQIAPRSMSHLTALTQTSLNDTCHLGRGQYLFSISATSPSFSMAFDHCADASGNILDGTVNGTFMRQGLGYSAAMTGNLTLTQAKHSIRFEPINLVLALGPDMDSFYLSHDGMYHYAGRSFRGPITVNTVQPIGVNLATLARVGGEHYRDASGNDLTVEHNNNGVQVYFNGIIVQFYSAEQWADGS
ncbi:hypothetical protein [Reinekea sp.]|jgi:hypothetical protein|uniref:hypothetical protein n=1 Tax=Reinekea sp. TaxID=1970455 RepID=UPI002A7FDEDC|nr:hypothetical protein [Reinekea sp.]